ncbi:MAG: hypothetical protein AAF629_04405 [Chloroflexota bacterium]
MCRYAGKSYKLHFACFGCRKAFRKPPVEDYMEQKGLIQKYNKLRFVHYNKTRLKKLETELNVTRDELHNSYIEQINKCPQCGNVMADLGRDIKVPRKNNQKAWRILEGMYHLGHSFYTCGCDGIGFVPKNQTDFVRYLTYRLKDYQSQLKKADTDNGVNPTQKQGAQAYWEKRIIKIEREIKKCQSAAPLN